MTVFSASRSYQRELDIRLVDGLPVPGWVDRLVRGQAPNSPAWLVVMPRRAGKSWLAKGIAHARAEGSTLLVDLRFPAQVRKRCLDGLTGGPTPLPLTQGQMLIVDEPALGARATDPAVLAEGLVQAKEQGAVPVVFATPAEHALLARHLGPDVPKDVLRPPLLDAAEQARMAARAPEWAPALTELVREREPSWLTTPYLLELALGMGEEMPGLRDRPEELLAAAAQHALHDHQYVEQWFHDGLGAPHRAALRAGRWRAAGLEVPEGTGELRGEERLADDPVLARHLPEVLRVHHVSDLHHGGRLNANVDAKDGSAAGRKIAAIAGAGTPMDSYLDHVRQLRAHGRAPHLVVVTGDLVNRPHDAYGALARDWLAELAGLLAPHQDLAADDPRIVLVGGNHDVSWDLALDPSPQRRHAWFADHFAGYPHPDLHLGDPAARRLYVSYPAVGLRFALLGSAESGGEAARDEDRERLRAAQEAYLAAADDERRDEDAVAAVVHDFERVDPGVVARGVLDRLAAQPGYVTVAALHHPLSPVPAVEVAPYSGVVNAGQAKRALAGSGTALILHGHTHLAFGAAERLLGAEPPWTMRIAGAPALASSETDERNGYNELFVAREGGAHALALRTLRFDGGQWAAGPAYAFRPGGADELPLADLCAEEP
ncbi:metallophosphoesterase family protein [Actinacidiphila rubida]|uniref:Calcineurin-like phosphoesterase n=1 Tax=Actinacidiphila rubida TaxID=310780 RepID=A0A1H8KU99_9ACTN|nr:metallophosphoesterase [Actinacidiphila rubida]SEN96445.1 Calcineurin-like phosphoesterase [Actinacidiphila rubida]